MHPRYKRYFLETLSFGLIWMLFGFIYVFIEYGLLGSLPEYPATGNQYNFKNSLMYVGAGSFMMGMVQGWIEVRWLRRRFEKQRFFIKLMAKGGFYLLLIVLFLVLLTWVINSRRFDEGLFAPEVLESLWPFFSNFAFWSTVLYVAAILGVALFVSEIGQYLGIGVLGNFILGKYHRPRKETRIFMFLDMRSSTSIAERMGHERYFELLRAYYGDMTEPILLTFGQVYQYVGDEIVISWPKHLGLYHNNCLQCLLGIQRKLRERAGFYEEQFGMVPTFKAGLHLGEVTVGEIGIIKKEMIYTGDVLNTTSRIQAQCDAAGAMALISGELAKALHPDAGVGMSPLGSLNLRGKEQTVALFKLEVLNKVL